MRSIKPNTRRGPLSRTVLLAIVAIVFGGAATVAVLVGLKVIDPAKFWGTTKPDHPAGWVGVPLSARSIPAYTKVTKENLCLNPKTGELLLKWMPPNEVPPGIITDVSKIVERVTAREKPAVYFFLESDFLPVGSSPGIGGGTPLGKLAITLDAAKLKGVHDLKEGDHVDLLASVAVDMPGAGHSNSGKTGTSVVTAPDVLLLPKRGVVNVLVRDGVVVTPVKIRNVPTTFSSLTQGTTTRTMAVQEIVLAVAPEEVRLVAEAIDLKYEITCAVHSGRPAPVAQSPPGTAHPNPAHPGPAAGVAADRGAKPASGVAAANSGITPGLDPLADYQWMEVWIGKERQVVLFNGPGNSPVVVSQDDGAAKAGPAGAGEEKKE
jgi:hypothetical protein